MASAEPLLALTMGEPAGIGLEIAIKAFAARERENLPRFVLLADPGLVAETARRLGIAAGIATVATAQEARDGDPRRLHVLPVPLAKPVRPGAPDPANADAVIAAIAQGVALVRSGAADALVTNPIAKSILARGGFSFPGHTEFLASLSKEKFGLPEEPLPVMMLAGPRLRTVPITIHLPLIEAVKALTIERVVATARIVAEALVRDFGIAAPRLALGGLNPHAGEDGRLGTDETRILVPAVARLKAEGIDIKGPLAADSLFHARARETYDAALLPTHDQALIPVKTLDFEETVNVTLGLPFVRTSPDHGTALDIAGKGTASERGLIAALALAAGLAMARRASEA